MLGWAKGLFSSQVESNNLQEVPIKDQSDKIIEGTQTGSSFLKKDLVVETAREPKTGGMEEQNGTSTRKAKKDKKKKKKMGGSASVLQRGHEIANSQGSSENIAAPEQTSAILPTSASELSGKKEKRKRRKSHSNIQTDDRHKNGQAAGSESSPSEQIGEPDFVTAESESANSKHSKSERKRKHLKSHEEGLKTEDEANALVEPLAAAHLAEAEQQEQDAETQEDPIAQESTTIHSGSKKKNQRKKQRSGTSHSTALAEEETLPEEMEVQAGATHGKENSKKKKKKSKSEKLTSIGAVGTNDEGRDQDQIGNSVEKSTLDVLDNHSAEQIHPSKSNSGKRKKLIYAEGPDADSHILDKPILPQAKSKKYNAKPKTSKVSRTEASDANSAALLNQFISARKNPQAEAEPVVLSAKALGKRPAVDQPIEHQSKKRKQIDSDPRNGDIRSMFSDDAQHGSSKVAASKKKQRTRISTSNFEVSIPSPAVKTSRSGTEEMAAWSATDKRSASARNDKNSSEDGSEFQLEQQSDEAEVTRRKRYLPVDEPSLVGLGTSESGKKSKQPKSDKSSSTKRGKGKKGSSNEVKPKRSRSQSVTRPKDGNGRLNEDETKRIADAVELYLANHDLEQQAVNVIIQGNAITDGKKFWDFMTEEVPDIPKRNMQSWCRRNFHNYAARGVWTTEQDEELMEVFNRMPKKWSLIGAELNRLPDDCRDRWRNYLSVTNLELGPWKLQEEQQLRDAVKKCIELIREDRRRDGLLKPEEEDDDTYHEHDISWMKVSELMDLSRSHLQCYRKWKSIKAREHATTDDLIAERIVISNSWKNLKNYQEATKSLAAEKLQFLKAIRDSKAGAESKIDWRAIDEKLDRNHEAMEMRICLRGLLQNITGHTNKPLQENVKLLIRAFEESAPHEPEGYVDLPFESTGLKKRTKRSKTSTLFENNPQLYDVGGSDSKSKMRHRMLNKDKSQRNHNSTDPDDGQLDTVQVPDLSKKAKRAAPIKKPTKTFALSTERVMDSESDEDDGAPTSAQKPRVEEEEDDDDDDEDVLEPRAKTKQMSQKRHSQRVAKTEIVEDISDDEQESHLESDSNSNLEPEDVEMADVQDDPDNENSDIETSQSTQFNLGGNGSNRNKSHSNKKDAKTALDNPGYGHPAVDSDDDSEMEDPDEPQVPATPEYELQEGYSGIREQNADLDESGQNYGMSEDEIEDDEESIMDNMSDIPAKVVKKRAPGVNGERGVYLGRDASVDLDR